MIHLGSLYIKQYLSLTYRYKEKYEVIPQNVKDVMELTIFKSITPGMRREGKAISPIEAISEEVLHLDESLQELWKLILSDLKPSLEQASKKELLHDWLDT